MSISLNKLDSMKGQFPAINPSAASLAPAVNPRADRYGVVSNFVRLEANFRQATINFSEPEVIQYVRDGHLPPPQQAFKIRKKYNINIATSLIVLANGTVFRTGKNKEIRQGDRSMPGGNESIKLGEGFNKRVFSVEDLNTHKQVAIAVAKSNDPDILSEMHNEADVTSKIPSPYILRVDYFVRLIEPKPGTSEWIRKGYLESEVCVGGALKQHPELAKSQIVRHQILKAVSDIHNAGFAHRDISIGNIVFVQNPDTQDGNSLAIKLIDFAQARKLDPANREEWLYDDTLRLNGLLYR